MLTSLNREEDMLKGLAAGADDFLSKPFSPKILLARAQTVLRRSPRANGHNGHTGNNGDDGSHGKTRHNGQSGHNGNVEHSASFSYNDGYLSINIERHEVLIHGKRIKLTPIEFRLLVYLARNGGKLLTFDRILTNVWGGEYQGSIDYVHVYISHLRRKIDEHAKGSRYIMTVHGVGYVFEKQEVLYQP
jgi:two-component system alkaline phosphatase synthesis response regulator PhoP